RAFVTLLVLGHHAALAYHPFAPPPMGALHEGYRLWQAFPVVDAARWGGAAWFGGLNDTFFMSLMFFLSGVFVWPSVRRKGAGGFLRDRALRLGVGFLAVAAIVAPLAYYPAYLLSGAEPGLRPYMREWLTLGSWPAGPAWFLWVLLAFDCVAATVFALAARGGQAAAKLPWPVRRGASAFALLGIASAAGDVP